MSDNAIGSHIPKHLRRCRLRHEAERRRRDDPRQQPQQQLTARIRGARWILVRSCHT